MRSQNNVNSTLHCQISQLPYSQAAVLSNDTYEQTLTQLGKLWPQYGYAQVLGELHRQWSIEKSLSFFEKMGQNAVMPKPIQTIGTFYHRGYGGGIERAQAQLMTLWTAMGYRVVFFSDEPENPLDFPYPSTVKRIQIPKAGDVANHLAALQECMIAEKVDVFINHDWTNGVALWEAVLTKMMNVAYVTHVHGHFVWPFMSGKSAVFLTHLFRMSSAVVALSEASARFYQLAGCKTYLVENPIPEDLMNISRTASLDSSRILMVGRVAPEKYPMEAIQIFKLVHDACPNAVLDVVGADSEGNIARMTDYCVQNGLLDSVVFHGAKNSEEINALYSNAACMLFSSKMEGYPMVLLEAKAHGVPIAMYDLSFLTLVKDKKGVLTAPVGDIQGVANNIIHLLRDDTLRKACGRAAREDFEAHAAYDLQQAWADIFALCEKPEKVKSAAYFDPASLPEAEYSIVPMLLDTIEKSYTSLLNESKEYRLGRKLLKIPRTIKRFLGKIKHILKNKGHGFQ